METKCISDKRDMIIHVLEKEQGAKATFAFAPDFTCTVGSYRLLRDGRIVTSDDSPAILRKLAYLGLCDPPDPVPQGCLDEGSPSHELPNYPVKESDGAVVCHLFAILSARQRILNQALAARGNKAFYVDPALMDRLLAHPPRTLSEVLQVLYDFPEGYRGIKIERVAGETCLCRIVMSGFDVCPRRDAGIHRQLADHIFAAAASLRWVKPYTRNVRNRKYALHTWLYSIGMGGPEHEAARRVLLDRVYGKAGQKKL